MEWPGPTGPEHRRLEHEQESEANPDARIRSRPKDEDRCSQGKRSAYHSHHGHDVDETIHRAVILSL
jgi:hypothetical protein